MIGDSDGDYIKYVDHLSLLAEAEREVHRWLAEVRNQTATIDALQSRLDAVVVKWDGECAGFLDKAKSAGNDYIQEGIYRAAESTLRNATNELRAAIGCATTGEEK